MPNITIDNTEYNSDNFTDKQKALLDNVLDLEQKLKKANQSALQLQVCLNVFVTELKKDLAEPSDPT